MKPKPIFLLFPYFSPFSSSFLFLTFYFSNYSLKEGEVKSKCYLITLGKSESQTVSQWVTQHFSDIIVMCIQMADSMAWKQKPQSAFLAICPFLNITFRDNRQKCRLQVLSMIHCTGRSELLKYFSDITTTGSLCYFFK